MPDVIVVGGGVIGLSVACELAEQGVRVAVFDRQAPGQEASWAGAGMLPPGNPEHASSPESLLRGWSRQLWDDWAASLHAATGIDTGFRCCGGLQLALDDAKWLDELCGQLSDEQVDFIELSPTDLQSVESQVSGSVSRAVQIPSIAQVRNPRLLKALIARCGQLGVELRDHEEVRSFDVEDDRIVGVETSRGRASCSKICIASGAWTQNLLSSCGCEIPVRPLRGQIVLLSALPLPFRHILESGRRYLVPRADGRILIGSTEENVGFNKHNTAAGVAGLIQFAESLVPALQEARFERSWAGLRPHLPDELPVIDRVPGFENAYVAAGHFRAGLSLSPVTAVLMRQLILEQELLFPIDGLSSTRFESPEMAEAVLSH